MIAIIIIAILGAIGAFISVENVKLKSRLDNSRGNAERLAVRLIDRNHEIGRLKQAAQPMTWILSYTERAAEVIAHRLGLDPRSTVIVTNARTLEGARPQRNDRVVRIQPHGESGPATWEAWEEINARWLMACTVSNVDPSLIFGIHA